MWKHSEVLTQPEFKLGLNTTRSVFNLQPGQSPAALNVEFNNDGTVSKRLGISSMNSVQLELPSGYGMYDLKITTKINAYGKLIAHFNGTEGAQSFIDATLGHPISGNNIVHLDETVKKFGSASCKFSGNDTQQLLIHFDGANGDTADQTAATGQLVSLEGAAQLSTTQKKFGTASLLLNGTTDYATVPDSANWDFSTDDFTIDGWFYKDDVSSDNRGVVTCRDVDDQNGWQLYIGSNLLQFAAEGGVSVYGVIPTLTWVHFAVVRYSNILTLYINGVSTATQDVTGIAINNTNNHVLGIGMTFSDYGAYLFKGWIDEVRICKGIARWTTAFTPYSCPYAAGDYLEIADSDDFYFNADYSIDAQVNFANCLSNKQVLVYQGINSANSHALIWNNSLGICYENRSANVLRRFYHGRTDGWTVGTSQQLMFGCTGNTFKIFRDGSLLASSAMTLTRVNYTSSMLIGCEVGTDNAYGSYFNGYLDELRVSKGLCQETSTGFVVPTEEYPSLGLEQQSRLLCANGTGIYYSSDLGKNWYICQTSRTAERNNFALVKQYVINVNAAYNAPQYWMGTAGTYFANISTAAPNCKYVLSHQGFCLMLNEQYNKNSMYYVDDTELFTATWDNFAFPTSRNDEITTGVVLNKNLYVSTKFKIFKVLYVGGNPDWSYYEVKDFGFVPNTAKKISIPKIGEVIIGLDWNKRLRLFDGSNDMVVSDNLEENNGMTPFYLEQMNESALENCWAENDSINQLYKVFIPKSPNTSVNWCITYNYRNGSLYVDNNRTFASGIVTEDAYNKLHFLVCTHSGRICEINSGNTDMGTPVEDYFISPINFNNSKYNSPEDIIKLQRLSMYFSVSSSGTLYFEDRTNLSSIWNLRNQFEMNDGLSAILTSQIIDIPETVNTYQFKLSSSSNTANPWTMLRSDFFFGSQGGGRA